jgi:hypothetical protein
MTNRITLRDLPLAARLVLACFLCCVGLGYFSALVQLHLQHGSRDGHALPTAGDVIERFSGLKKYDPNAPAPPSTIERLVSGPGDAGWGKNNMAPAFFEKSGGKYGRDCAERGKATVDAERDGERKALIAWVQSVPAARKKAYDDDAFPFAPPAITEDFFDREKKTVPIKTLIEVRCVKCHNGDQKPDLDEYAKLEPLVTPPSQEVLPGGWVASGKQMSIESLTQSTHAHLLSFAVLFTLTGLTFALSSYPGWLRCVIGPIVLVAQFADVACWWLARLPNVGPSFAQAILTTGGVVGIGLSAQIVLGVFDLFGKAGRAMLLVLFMAAGLGFAVLFVTVIGPNLERERQALGAK